MNIRPAKTLAFLIAFATLLACAAPSFAQDKPPMYTYVGNWSIPRAQWGEMEKSAAADQGILDKALANGTLVGFGSDVSLVHTADGFTHDDWWSSMSMAGLVHVLDQFYASGNSTTSVLASSTKHTDQVFVSRCYNRKAGSWKTAYTHGGYYKFKPDAPSDATEMMCKQFIEPLMEKMLADGTIVEYELDTEAIHTESPDAFYIFYIAATPEGLDKVNAALREMSKANPLRGPAFEALTDYTAHRDMLARSVVTYK